MPDVEATEEAALFVLIKGPVGALYAVCGPLAEQQLSCPEQGGGGGLIPLLPVLRFAWAPSSGDQVCGECLAPGAIPLRCGSFSLPYPSRE